jgi:hypothetical protein
METAKELMGRFPIDDIFFILSSGIFVVFSFPFDVFKALSNGLPTLTINIDSFTNLKIYIDQNFEPFASIKYLGDFPNGLIKLLLLSLAVGAMIYLLYAIYEKSNHFIMRQFEKIAGFTIKNRACKSETRSKPMPTADALDFLDWVQKRRLGKSIDVLWSMRALGDGLFYGCETFFLIIILSCLFGWHLSEWLLFSFLLGVFLYVAQIAYEIRFRGTYDRLVQAFNTQHVRQKTLETSK